MSEIESGITADSAGGHGGPVCDLVDGCVQPIVTDLKNEMKEIRSESVKYKRNNTLFEEKIEARLEEHQNALDDIKRNNTLYAKKTNERLAEHQHALKVMSGRQDKTENCINRVEGVETLNMMLLSGMGGFLILFVVGALYFMKKKMNSNTSDVHQLTNEATELRRYGRQTRSAARRSANILEGRINQLDPGFWALREQIVSDSERHRSPYDATGQAHLPDNMQLISIGLPPV